MVAYWEPGIHYNAGDVVEYNGHRYRVIQGHSSQSDWAPSEATAALFGRIPEHEYQNQHPQGQPQQQHFDQPPAQSSPPVYQHQGSPAQQQQQTEKPWDQHTEQTVDIPHEEKKKKWYEIDDHRKKQLEIGGGLLAGAALLGGGYYAWHEHEKNEEKKKANVWALQGWNEDAKNRTEKYHQHGPQGELTWILVEGHNIPNNAIRGGEEGGKPLFVARAFCDGGVQVGKAGAHLGRGAAYGYCHKTYDISSYEVLVGNSNAIRWVPTGGVLRIDQLGARPVEGGHENDGTPIYIASVDFHGSRHCGKATTKLDGAYIAYGDKEERVKEYSVLCYQ